MNVCEFIVIVKLYAVFEGVLYYSLAEECIWSIIINWVTKAKHLKYAYKLSSKQKDVIIQICV